MLFLDAEGRPAALKDRCCHRTAKLSKGQCVNGQLQCGYHDWTYDRSGQTAPFLLAFYKGYLKEDGLDVSIDVGNGSVASILAPRAAATIWASATSAH